MSGFVGFVNFNKDISKDKNILEKMNSVICPQKTNNTGYYIDKHVGFYYKDIVSEGTTSIQPLVEEYSFGTYVTMLNGYLYNKNDLQKTLLENNFTINSDSDSEILLKSYIYYGNDIVNHLNGAYSFIIWNSQKSEIFLARDHFGIKPLFYTIIDNCFVFSSEIKGVLSYPGVSRILDETGISELFGIGPAHTPGLTVFKNIYELKPAHFAIFNASGLHSKRYWKLTSKVHSDSLGSTCEKVRFLLTDSINNQLISDKPICTFLSGGLDSSIVSKVASDYNNANNLPSLNTYSVDYVDNDKNFVKSDFQPNSDNYYIDIMHKHLNTNHHKIVIDTPELASSLQDAMIARDMPGMADIDSSLLLFCKNVKKDTSIALTGECADEIFGGYPWFFRSDALQSKTFPWSISLAERQHLLNPAFSSKINLKEYVDYRYNQSLSEVDILPSDSSETAEKRKISHLTLNWFMQTLLERSDRMSRYNDFEIRVPFCDYKLAEYVWNIPWEWKALKGREKGLLRYACKDLLPSEIIDRKKSPYPKTQNPNYLSKVKEMLSSIMADNNSPINDLLNREYILEILKTDGKAFTRPWFGQLMVGPQLMAYICQVNMWLEKYKPTIKL